jgi:hypothetical protein
MVFGQRHLNVLMSHFTEHYDERRAHSSREFISPACGDAPVDNNTIDLENIVCREEFSGAIKSSYRRAA